MPARASSASRGVPVVDIRAATDQDQRAISRLLATAFADKLVPVIGSPGAAVRLFEEAWQTELGRRAQVIVAERRGEMAGAIVLRTTDSPAPRDDRALWRALRRHTPWWRLPLVLLALSLLDNEAEPDRAYVDALAVATPFRGHGIGGALLRSAFEWARDQGVSEIDLDVSVHNPGAQRLYERNGFCVRATRYSLLMRLLVGHLGFRRMSRVLRDER